MKWRTKQNHVLGHVLVDLGLVVKEQLEQALALQAKDDRRPLGIILVELGHVTTQQVEHALMVQRARRGDLEQADSLRLLDHAVHCTKRAASCIDDLTNAAQELTVKAKG